nr:DNA polymerase zeta catalytic subunit [Bactrocera oleae]
MSEAKEDAGVFSVRLVIADFYMEKPIFGFDPCYSEFRGKEIKRVPIIRIFGSSADGRKTCMHVHGVFPYFYIPYEAKEFESLNKAIYQITSNVDKAINISLGQACSGAIHVFKVQLVKGIPFYGYHRGEHQFLKIYMFNPRFVRRAANLLQSGAIMNTNFHPYESHVPYILQFMIDYNLYGMSFVHIPLDVVKFRQAGDEHNLREFHIPALKQAQFLNPTVAKKQSTCVFEVDIGSNFILNRFQLALRSNNSKTHSNPGIEAIWNDERLRRQKMAERSDVDKVPDLELPPTQERYNVQPTESDIFHRTVLQSKLMALELSVTGNVSQADQSTNLTLQTSNANFSLVISGDKEQKHTFNLRKIIGNAIYPEECTPDENLVDASFIENHVSQNGFLLSSSVIQSTATPPINTETADRRDNIFLDDTVVDEELFSNFKADTPKQSDTSLGAEDLELLDILQQLEEHEEDENQIDLDSTLAPLTQTHKKFDPSPELLDKQVIAAAMSQPLPECDTDSDTSENGNLHDYSIILEDMDELILKFTPSQPTEETDNQTSLPQMDGSDDLLPKTPVKGASSAKTGNNRNVLTSPRTPRITNGPHLSPKRSPRTPKSSASKKYAPLPLTITCKKQERNVAKEVQTTPARHTVLRNLDLGSCDTKSTKMTLSKKLALTALRRKSVDWSPSSMQEHITASKEPSDERSVKRTPIRRSRRTMDLDRTHITCELTPRRKSERILKVYSIEEEEKLVNAPEGTRKYRSVVSPLKVQKQNKTKETLSDASKKRCRNKLSKFAQTKNQTEEVSSKEQQKKSPVPRQHQTRKCVVRISKSLKQKALDNSSTNTPEPSNVITHNNNNEIADDRQLDLSKSTIYTSPQLDLSEDKEKRLPNNISPQLNASDSDEIAASDTEDAPTPISAKRLRRSFHLIQHRRMQKNDVSNKYIHETTKSADHTTKSSISSTEAFKIDTDDGVDIEDPHIQSFYDISFTDDLSSPPNFKEISSPTKVNLVKDASSIPLISYESNNSIQCCQLLEKVQNTTSKSNSSTILINIEPLLTESASNSAKQLVQLTPLNLPPSYEEVLTSCVKLDIPEYEFQKPFYGNPDDITRLKEVGHIALHIPGNTLNDCEEFKSVLGDELKGLTEWRRQQMLAISGPSALTTHCSHRNTQRIREYFAEAKRVTITPQICPPTRKEAKLWLKARDMLAKSETCAQNKVTLDESPIKVRRQKTTMILNDGGGGCYNDEDVLNNTNCITLTPPTPLANTQRSSNAANTTEEATAKPNANVKLKLRTKRAKLSLNKKLIACASPEMSVLSASDSLQLSQIAQSTETLSSEQVVASNDTTISNETVLNALKRNSFLKDLQSKAAPSPHELSFGLSSASLDNTFGFKVNLENLQQAKSDVECNYLTTIILELFVPTRGNLLPDPVHDEVRCLFYAIEHRSPATQTKGATLLPQNDCGCIIVKDIESENAGQDHHMYGTGGNNDVTMRFVNTEIEAFEALVELSMRWDPDIYGGYEIETASWGYVLERGKHLGFNIAPLLSRVPTQKVREFVDEDREHFTDLDIELKLCGRILLDVWRLMRSEIALTSYTFENVMYHILHKRCPSHNHRALTEWFEVPYTRWIVIEYYVERVRGTLALLDQLDLIGRTSEMAKLIGIQFYEVLSRGSQFRVESMMLRRWIQTDPRRIPRCGERVPFIIVNGPPGVPLIRLVRSPHEVLADEGLKINAIYYITKAIIPPLNRCLLLIGADVNEWFASLPRKLLIVPPTCTANKLAFNVEQASHAKKITISQYFSATNCIASCGRQTKQGICEVCERQTQRTFVILHQKMAKIERGYQLVQQICQACCGRVGEIKCSSLDCPVLYVNEVKRRDLQQVEHIRKLLAERF